MEEVEEDREEDCEAAVAGEEATGAFPADREAPPAPMTEGNVVNDVIKDAQDVHQEEREHLGSFT
jgi:hypothetical protein